MLLKIKTNISKTGKFIKSLQANYYYYMTADRGNKMIILEKQDYYDSLINTSNF